MYRYLTCRGGCRAAALLLATLISSLAAARPNVLLIMVDDLNDHVGHLGGHPQAVTPHIDALADRGISFTNAHSPSPSCNPARSSLLTGIGPLRSGVIHNDKPLREYAPDAISLVRLFRDDGYHTAGFGKMFHDAEPETVDWDEFALGLSMAMTGLGLADPRLSGLPLQGRFDYGMLDVPEAAMDDYRNVDRAITFLEEHPADGTVPFFLAVGLSRPHLPWYCPPGYFDRIAGGDTRLVELPRVLPGDLDDVTPRSLSWATFFGDDEIIQAAGQHATAIHSYLACGSFADAQVGRLVEALDAGPFSDDTVVALVSDHGWHLGEKQTWRKGKLWEEATRVPLVFRLPDGVVTNPRSRVTEPANAAGLFQTLLDIAGIPAPDYVTPDPRYRVDFTSLLPLFRADYVATGDERAVTVFGGDSVAIRTERYRFIRDGFGFVELYDHATDPDEFFNVADDPRYAEVTGRLNAQAMDIVSGHFDPIGPDDPDRPYRVAVDDVSVSEGAGLASFTLRLEPVPPVGDAVDVRLDFNDGTAALGSDYAIWTTELTFAGGVTERTVFVDLLDDLDVENDETFSLSIDGPRIRPVAAKATIVDDDEPMPTCGKPDYDPTVDNGVFLWNQCGTDRWIVRMVAGGEPALYTGTLMPESSLASLMLFSYEPTDIAPPRFEMGVGNTGVDGLDFSVVPGTSVCLAIELPAGVDLRVGRDRLNVGRSVSIPDLRPCAGMPPPVPQCGPPVYDSAAEPGLYLWRDCGGSTWNLRAVGGGGGLAEYKGRLMSADGFLSLETLHYEADDVAPPAFAMRVGGPGEDGIRFTTRGDAEVCLTMDAPAGAVITAGANRVDVGHSVRLPDFRACDGP